ncbi:MAG: hypothetical protein RIR53_1759 [Bacteroidota bacterium]
MTRILRYGCLMLVILQAVALTSPLHTTHSKTPYLTTRILLTGAGDTTDIMNDYDPETERDGGQIMYDDRYRGRSKWTSEQYASFVDSVGIDSRTGQSAAVAQIITSMRQGDMQGARARLQKLMATPGYILDSDVAQMLLALDMLLQRENSEAKSSRRSNMSNRVDTVYRIDTVYREVTRVDTVKIPADNQERENPGIASAKDTVYVDVVKYDTIYVDRQDTADPMRDLAGNAIPETSEQLAQSNQTSPASDVSISQKLDMLTNEVIRLRGDLHERSKLLDLSMVTRRCYTIRVAQYSSRETAEQHVKRLKRIFKRTRLAISKESEEPYSVIVGYYETAGAANQDADMVSRTTGQRCQTVMTTIAEQL